MESLGEIAKTLIANPVRAVERRVPFVENLWIILDHEFGPAESAMIVVVSFGWPIAAMNQRNPHKVILLACEAPIFVVDHNA